MKKFLKNNLWITGMVIGAAGGYLYWYYIGCLSGTCAITSKPLNSIVYFGFMGGLLFNIIQPKKQVVSGKESGSDDNPA